jgi:AraC family transcriptional regulator of adaptative response/methylated-DNA-[protein]-cysteine methyltransferase
MPDTAECRRALRQRDARYDGRFVHGAPQAGVYCRPSCAAQAAYVDDARFYPTASAASAAGLRACRRCRPDAAANERERLQELATYIQAHAEQTLPLAALARRIGLSPTHLQRRFSAVIGVSPKALQDAARMRTLKKSLRGGARVTDAIYEAGFGSSSRVYGEALRNLGMTPGAYRAGGAGEQIHHAVRTTAIGPLLMAATERGVCFAQFGTDAAQLLAQLQAEFPQASLLESNAQQSPALDAWITALDAHISRGAARPEVPLDLRGTAFQIRVWRFLLGVREGEVLAYGELARGVDAPRAQRAVASACAANRIAVLVPCHRVLRGDGGLGGYRWGVERKRALLDAERARRPERRSEV